MCGWYQDQSDNFDWSLNSGMDHTIYDGSNAEFMLTIVPVFKFEIIEICLCSPLGRSLVVDMWDVSLLGLSGRLLSVRQNVINTEHCLSFFYKLYGPNIGGFEKNLLYKILYCDPGSQNLSFIRTFVAIAKKCIEWSQNYHVFSNAKSH